MVDWWWSTSKELVLEHPPKKSSQNVALDLSKYIHIYIHRCRVGLGLFFKMDLNSNSVRSKLYNRDLISIIQAVRYDLLSQSYLYTKNYMIWEFLAYTSSDHKII